MAQTLRKARASRGLSIRELATLAGVSPVTVGHIERHVVRQPRYRVMRLISGALGVKESAITEFRDALARAGKEGEK